MHKSSIKFSLRRSQQLLACVSVFLLAASVVSACPSCKDAYTPGSSDSAIGESYSYSVLFFLGMFFSLLGGGILFLRWKITKAMSLKADLRIANQ